MSHQTLRLVTTSRPKCITLFDRNLPRNKRGRAPNPVVTAQVSGEQAQSTEAVMCNHNPVYEQEFVFRVTSALSDNLTLKVVFI